MTEYRILEYQNGNFGVQYRHKGWFFWSEWETAVDFAWANRGVGGELIFQVFPSLEIAQEYITYRENGKNFPKIHSYSML